MLIGRYDYALDAKNRLNFPARFRAEMGETSSQTAVFQISA